MSQGAQAQGQHQESLAGARVAPEAATADAVQGHPGSAATEGTRRRRREKLRSLDELQHSLTTVEAGALREGAVPLDPPGNAADGAVAAAGSVGRGAGAADDHQHQYHNNRGQRAEVVGEARGSGNLHEGYPVEQHVHVRGAVMQAAASSSVSTVSAEPTASQRAPILPAIS